MQKRGEGSQEVIHCDYITICYHKYSFS